MTQLETLKSYFKRRKTLTQMEAFNALGITRLSERVRELEAAGYIFARKPETVASRYGSARVVRYQLVAGE